MIFSFLLSLWLFLSSTSAIDIFVSTDGNDAADGSFSSPYLTLTRAQEQVRKIKSTATDGVHVILRGGTYEVQETIDMTVDDSGESVDAPVTYEAYCDPQVLLDTMDVLLYPYKEDTSVDPRYMWNGVGNIDAWEGPVDPIGQMGVEKDEATDGSTITDASDLDTGRSVCLDKVGIGHVCYSDPMDICVSGCMVACSKHESRKMYPSHFYQQFIHLFGKDLEKEEDCVENCSMSCRGCERVVLSGSTKVEGSDVNWATDGMILTDVHNSTGRKMYYPIFYTSLEGIVDAYTVVSQLYLDDTLLPRAGFPNCDLWDDIRSVEAERSAFQCQYASASIFYSSTLQYNVSDMSSKVSTWRNVADGQIEVRPNKSSEQSLFYSISSIDTNNAEIKLAAGGAELRYDYFWNKGTETHQMLEAGYRIENIFQELDSPGEWFYDANTQDLYIIPKEADTSIDEMAQITLTIPRLEQILRVRGSYENRYLEADHALEEYIETNSSLRASSIHFRHLVFSGTRFDYTNVYEQMPASSWPMSRVAAVFLESANDVWIQHCTFEKVGGNALMVSGESMNVVLDHNNVSYIGGNGISILGRYASLKNAFKNVVLDHLLLSRNLKVTSNQIHHFGRQIPHSAGIMVVAAKQTEISSNLVYAYPGDSNQDISGANYWIVNANGAAYNTTLPLIHLFDPFTLSNVHEAELSTRYEVTVTLSNTDIPIVAKLVGAPSCASGSGRDGAVFDYPYPFTYTNCSDCCSVHSNGAQLRVLSNDNDATKPWDAVDHRREAMLQPGQTLQLAATSSDYFNSIIDIYVAFQVVTPNRVLDLPYQSTRWRITTRSCVYQELTYTATCGGPCGDPANDIVAPCGIGNIPLQESGSALHCPNDYEADIYSHTCTGPFESTIDCDNNGIKKHTYVNCSIECFTTTCT